MAQPELEPDTVLSTSSPEAERSVPEPVKKVAERDFRRGPVVEAPPSNAGGMVAIPG